jgi:hypothetical protein
MGSNRTAAARKRPLIPDNSPWREVVTAATQFDPARRPATVDELQLLIARALAGTPEEPVVEDPVAFARVISVLLSWVYPTIRHIDFNGPDRGRDAEFTDEDGLHVFETKSFRGPMNSSRKRQVQNSLVRAAATESLASWTLVTPIDPTSADLDWFHRLGVQYPFVLRWLGLSWIEDQLAQHPEIRPYYQGSIGN